MKKRIRLHFQDRWVSVDANVFGDWAAYKSALFHPFTRETFTEESWTVTHVPTGMSCLEHARGLGRRDSVEIAKRLDETVHIHKLDVNADGSRSARRTSKEWLDMACRLQAVIAEVLTGEWPR